MGKPVMQNENRDIKDAIGNRPLGAGVTVSRSGALRKALMISAAAGALFAGYGRSVRAQSYSPASYCSVNGTIVTCTGDLSDGVDVDGGSGAYAGTYDTLYVKDVTADITPDDGYAGIEFTSDDDITIVSDTGNYGIETYEANGIHANSTGGSVSITHAGNITTTGERVHGLLANTDVDADVTVTVTGDITTNSDYSDGINADSQGGDVAVTVYGNITTYGFRGDGIDADTDGDGDGDVTVRVYGDINTSGGDAEGIDADALGDFGDEDVTVTVTGNITTSGDEAEGIDADAYGDGDSDVTVTVTGNITTSGNDAEGIEADSDGTGDVKVTVDGNITTHGDRSEGIWVDSIGGNIYATITGDITTYGEYSVGIQAGPDSGAVYGAVAVEVTGNITTHGDYSEGILAQSYNGAVKVEVTGDITTGDATYGTGNVADGIRANSQYGSVSITHTGNITTQGVSSDGIDADTYSSGDVTVEVTGNITTYGYSSTGIYASSTFVYGDSGAVTVEVTGNITTDGDSSDGISAETYSYDSDAGDVTVTVTGDVTVTGNSTGIFAWSHTETGYSGNIDITLNGGTISSTDGSAVEFVAGATNTLTVYNEVTVSGGNGDVVGGSENETIVNYGTLTSTGDIDLDGGDNAFDNMAGAIFNSGDSVDLGDDNPFTNAGTLSPGGTGTLQTTVLTGNFEQTDTGSLQIEFDLSGDTDVLEVIGTVDIGGSTLDLIAYDDIEDYDIYTALGAAIIDNDDSDAVTGTFASGLNSAGDLFSVVDTTGGDGNDVVVTAVYRTTMMLDDGEEVTEDVTFPDDFTGFTFTVGDGDSAVFSGSFGESGTAVDVSKDGDGTLTTTGDNGFTGTMTVEDGTLINDGTLQATVAVEDGALFGGSGTSGGLTVYSGGTVAPGNSIGTLTIDGDVSFAAGSVFEVEVDEDGNSDLIDATGTATLGGGTVEVSGTAADGTTYTILTADGGVTGEFDELTGVSSTLFIEYALSYDDWNVYLSSTVHGDSFCDFASTANQQAVACDGLDSLDTDDDLVQAVLALSTTEEAQEAYDALSGEIHASLKGALMDNGWKQAAAVKARMHGRFGATDTAASTATFGLSRLADGQNGFWITGYGSWSDTDATGNTAQMDNDLGGVVFGIDREAGDHWRFGVLGGYGRSDVAQDSRSSSASIDSWSLGLYGGARAGQALFSFGGIFNWHDVETGRTASFSGFSDSLTADYNARGWQLFAEAGYRMEMHKATFEPFAGVTHIGLDTDGFSENGGLAALTASSDTQQTTFTTLGLRSSIEVGERIRTRGMAGWRHAFGDTDPTATFTLSGSSAFTVTGAPIAQDAFVTELGLDIDISARAILGVSYNGQYGDGATAHGFNAALRGRF